jgi:4-amino-4-deoxychorismate lyase
MTTDNALLDALINGRRGEEAVHILDRGLHYGDGLFETLAVRDGCAQLWAAHAERLLTGCRRLRLPPPDITQLENTVREFCAGYACATLKILLTRGSGARGYRIDHHTTQPTLALLLYHAPVYAPSHWREGVAVRYCKMRLAMQPALAGIKHLNRLEQVLARDEWQDADIAEGLMLDREGQVVCGTASNVFIVRADHLHTPALDSCGVAGVMRARILEAAASAGFAAQEAQLRPEDLQNADEVFLSNSLFGIWPVRRIDDVSFKPGPLARRFIATLGGFSLTPTDVIDDAMKQMKKSP